MKDANGMGNQMETKGREVRRSDSRDLDTPHAIGPDPGGSRRDGDGAFETA